MADDDFFADDPYLSTAAWRIWRKLKNLPEQTEDIMDSVSALGEAIKGSRSYVLYWAQPDSDISIEGNKIRKGTWLLCVEIDELEAYYFTSDGALALYTDDQGTLAQFTYKSN